MENDFKAILAEDPDSAETLNALGYSLADRTERFAESCPNISNAPLALKPDDPAVLDSMGWILFRLGNPEQALEYLRKALVLMPDGEIATHLGGALDPGSARRGRSTWEAALDRDPNHEYLLRSISHYNFTRSDSQSQSLTKTNILILLS